ncbi:MAG: fused MFS/spermidine synthase [Myxococcales bacterium]|nr:fused MFS/spermidine synthase [Myxococcales bacterium]
MIRRRDLLHAVPGLVVVPGLLPALVGGCAARQPTDAPRRADAGAEPEPEPEPERVIGEQRSRFNHVVVTERGSIRTMYFMVDGRRVTESVYDARDPYTLKLPVLQAMTSVLLVHPKPRRVLMIGVGGGQVTNYLFHHVPGIEIDAVDICPAVVELARAHFGVPDDPRYRLHVADGRRFIAERPADARWDVIVLDAYRGTTVPLHLRSRQHLEGCAARLPDDGVVIANLHSRSARYPDDRATFAAVFPQIYVFHSATDLEASLVATRAERRLTDVELSANADTLLADYGLHTRGLLARLEAEGRGPTDGRVLEDDFAPEASEAGIDRHNDSCRPRCAGDPTRG